MPEPRAGESQSDFISRCIPYVKNEEPGIEDDHAAAKCYGIWKQKHKHKHLYTLDMYEDGAVLWDMSCGKVNFFDAKPEDGAVFPAVCLVGDKFYKGKFVSGREIQKAFHSMNGAYHDLNHWSTDYPGSIFGGEMNIEYIVGYQDDTTYDPETKMMRTKVHIVDSAPKAQVWRGFMEICKQARRIPNVSVTFWAENKTIAAKDLPEGVNYKEYGFKENDQITELVDLEFHALATVFRGACSDADGCGIGIELNDTDDGSVTFTISTEDKFNSTDDEVYKLKTDILKEKIKKEELSHG